jgi:hypothetical protein
MAIQQKNRVTVMRNLQPDGDVSTTRNLMFQFALPVK